MSDEIAGLIGTGIGLGVLAIGAGAVVKVLSDMPDMKCKKKKKRTMKMGGLF
jgi:hypothetical protein